MADEAQQPLRRYRANCHCGSFVYEIDLPKVESVHECNCSLCAKKGYLWVRPEKCDSLEFVKGKEDDLSSYTFGSEKIHHKFCPHCGTGLLGKMQTGSDQTGYGFNVHAFQNVDTWSLERKLFDGKVLGSPYEPPKYDGPQPEKYVDGGKTYTGGCHCGRVQVALSSKPLDGTFPEPVAECKCSICERNAYLWVWPLGENVVLHGDRKDIAKYLFGSAMMGKTFCKTCGVQLTNEPAELSEEALAALPSGKLEWYQSGRARHPVNLRVLNGVDLALLTPQRLTTTAEMDPQYVNP